MAARRRMTIGEALDIIGPDNAQDDDSDEAPILARSRNDVFAICYGEPERCPCDDYDGTSEDE